MYMFCNGLESVLLSKGFRNCCDPQGNLSSQSTEMPPLVSMRFLTFLNPLEVLMVIMLVCLLFTYAH